MSITRCKNSITISGATEGRGRQGREDREQKERRKKLEWSLSTKEEARQTDRQTNRQTDGSTFILHNGHKMHVVPEDGKEIVVGGGDNGGNI